MQALLPVCLSVVALAIVIVGPCKIKVKIKSGKASSERRPSQ
jgi:hypothetical protein